MQPKEFDPIAYVENAFLDKTEGKKVASKGQLEVNVPSIGDYLQKSNGGRAVVQSDSSVGLQDKRLRFRRKKLSAPRPRRSKGSIETAPIDGTIQESWAMLPKNIEFLSKFFDDSITAHYYRGKFKESRQDLIHRLLDPELTLEEVSRLLGVCPATVRRYTNRGWLQHHRTIGGQRRFRLTGVVRFVEEHGRLPE